MGTAVTDCVVLDYIIYRDSTLYIHMYICAYLHACTHACIRCTLVALPLMWEPHYDAVPCISMPRNAWLNRDPSKAPWTFAYIWIYIYICIHIYTYLCVYTCVHVRMHASAAPWLRCRLRESRIMILFLASAFYAMGGSTGILQRPLVHLYISTYIYIYICNI